MPDTKTAPRKQVMRDGHRRFTELLVSDWRTPQGDRSAVPVLRMIHAVGRVYRGGSVPGGGRRAIAKASALRALLELHIAHHNNPAHVAARAAIAKAEGAQ